MSTTTPSIINDENEPRLVKRQNAALSIILIAIFSVIFIVGIILLIVFIVAPQGNQLVNKPYLSSSGVPVVTYFHNMKLLPRAVQNIPPGDVCVDQAQCVPGSYCNASGLCQVGTLTGNNQVCAENNDCGVGNYCGGGNVCVSGVGWTAGGPCINDNNCALGFRCDESICVGVAPDPVPDAFTTVAVYRISSTTPALHVTDLLTPNADASIFNGGKPVWFGCGETGINRVPVYLWFNSTLNDYIFSLSDLIPFRTGTAGYIIQNSGNPVMYVFTIQYQKTVPIYILQGFQLANQTRYHVSEPSRTALPTDQFLGSTMLYEQNANINVTNSFLGYAFIREQ